MKKNQRKFIDLIRKAFSVVIIYSSNREEFLVYVVDEFNPYNPSNHQYEIEILGKDITDIVSDYGVVSSDQMSVIKNLETRILEIPQERVSFSNHYQYEWLRAI